METSTLFGWIGAASILACYFLAQVGILSNRSKGYKFVNLIGSAILVVNAVSVNAYPFVLINSFWALISFVALFDNS